MTVGWILLVIGIIGLGFASAEYSAYQRNIAWYNYDRVLGLNTTEVERALHNQMIMIEGGLVIGLSMTLGGAYMIATRTAYNKKLDDVMIQKAMQPSQMYQPVAPGSVGFCSSCGYQLVSATEFCPKCGKKQG